MKLSPQAATLLALLSIAPSAFGEFGAITDPTDLSGVTAIFLKGQCTSTFTVPNVMFTIEPSDSGNVTVETNPVDLVTVETFGLSKDSSTLRFTFNEHVASTSNEGGIRIKVPADRLRVVEVADGYQGQVLDGFTSMRAIRASSGGTIWATLSSLPSDPTYYLSVSSSGGATANVKTNVDVTSSVSGGATVRVETPGFRNFDISGGAKAFVDGNLGDGHISEGAQLTATGSSSGGITLDRGGALNALSCDGVSGHNERWSPCTPGNFSEMIDIDTSERPETQTGTTVCNVNSWDASDVFCIGGSNLLYSCTADRVVNARDVSIGDKIRTMSATNDDQLVCSDVYYVFRHEDESNAIRFRVGSVDSESGSRTSSFTVSYNHIVYVGDSFEYRRPVLSQDVQIGDTLVTSKDAPSPLKILKIEPVDTDLVNILTVDPHLEIQNDNDGGGGNVIISVYSFDENIYGALFAPVKYAYLAFGAKAVEYMSPLFRFLDSVFSRPGVRGIHMTKSMMARNAAGIDAVDISSA